MDKRQILKKTIAWVLIAAMANPAAIAPAFARDTDIFLDTSNDSTVAEPNILLVLGTNDRMNVPEGWREYPGAYDSHTEYLWNNISIISNAEVPLETLGQISTAEQAVNPFSPYGFWGGATLTDRRAIWTAAKNYANATEPGGDPGPRNTWRNYFDLSLLYWVPAATAITDPRLRSVSFNTFRAHLSAVVGTRGGIIFNGTPEFPGFTGGDYRSYNQCASSVPQLTPSTVFAPTATTLNAGFMLNQQWVRYERWLNLTSINLAGYPGTAAQGYGSSVSGPYYRGYLDSTVAPTQVAPGFPVPPLGPAGTPPTNVYRDDDRGQNSGILGQPIRIPTPDSYAGWTDLKADRGGFEFLYAAYYFQFGSPFNLAQVRTVYGYPQSGVFPYAYDEVLSALKGNRDASPAFGMATGTPAYYDQTYGNCDPSTGPSPNSAPTSSTCINVPVAGAGPQNATWQLNCAVGGTATSEYDAANIKRFNGSALSCNAVGGVTCTFDPLGYNCGTGPGRAVALTPPALTCIKRTTNTFLTRWYDPKDLCRWSGQTPLTINTCQWSGRQSVFVEGQGTYFHGGSCMETGSTAHCSAGGVSQTLNEVARSNVLGPYQGQAPANGLTTLGCSNKDGAGTYSYGGTCGNGIEFTVSNTATGSSANPNPTRSSVDPAQCVVSGGFLGSVRGGPTQTFNQSCNGLGDLDQTCSARFGAACVVNDIGSCPNVTATTVAVPAGSTTNRWYQVYRYQNSDFNLVHDCLADQPAFNPGANSYMTKGNLTFGGAFNSVVGSSSATAAYTSSPGQAVDADSAKNIDVYSVNYLNWKFGPKGPNGHPIGRKTRLQIAKDSLSNLVQTTNAVRFGLMTFNRTAADLTNEGANVAKRIMRMGSNAADPDYVNRGALITAINAAVATSRTPLTESLYEAYRYFSGRTPKWGTSAALALSGGTVSQGYDASAICSAANGTDCPVTGVYRSPMLSDPNTTAPAGCQKNYVIMITNGQPEDDWSANDDIKSMTYTDASSAVVAPKTSVDTNEPDTSSDQFEQAGVRYGPVDLASTGHDDGYIWLDELAYFMGKADLSPGAHDFASDTGPDRIGQTQSVITYTIGYAGVDSPVTTNAATKSGGLHYDAQDSSTLSAALTAAVTAIRSFNPTIASPTVPLSAVNRAQSQNDVFLSFFQPHPSQAWLGTVKRFQLSTSEADCGPGIKLCTIGQTVLSSGYKNIEKTETVNGVTNTMIDPEVVSFWGPTSERDAGSSTKGGTGRQLINTTGYNPSTRKVYTHLGGTTELGLTDVNNAFNAGNAAITKTLLGDAAMDNAMRERLINFMRGGDPSNSACSDGDLATACTTWRLWPHFDVQHSKPSVVTYDAITAPPVQYLFYVSNNGMLHAVDANTGQEKWVFVIEEALAKITPMLADVNGQQLDIADGSPVVYFEDTNKNGVIGTGEKVWLFFGLRRGGRVYYALDITNRDAPAFKWKISNTAICNPSCAASTTFAELGQTWSAPVVGRIRKLGAATPALIFGGGYDPNQDISPVIAADTMGRAVFVVNSDTGALVKKFDDGSVTGGMKFSIPSDVAALNTDFDTQNFLDRVYVGDTGGNVYRFDINEPNEANWGGKKLAALSNLPDANLSERKRKILFPPVVVKYVPPTAPERFDGLFVGTGDREDPRLASANDKIVMIMDRAYGLTMNGDAAYQYPGDFVLIDNATTAGVTSTQLTTQKGWARSLDVGEKVVSSPTVFFGLLRFGTYAPLSQPNSCVPLGEGRSNTLDPLFGTILDINGNGLTAEDRYNGDATSSGLVSTGGIFVDPRGFVYYIAGGGNAGLPSQRAPIGRIGVPTKVYWYMVPEQ